MKKLRIFITKLLILIIMFLIIVISIKRDDNVRLWIKNKVFVNNLNFSKYQNIYLKYFGKIPFDYFPTTTLVFNEKLEYDNISKYKDGIVLDVKDNYIVPNLYDGIVIFSGFKDEYGNTIIIESENINIWYCNINSNIKLYDQVKKGEYLGEVVNNKLYLVFEKDGKLVEYKDYI